MTVSQKLAAFLCDGMAQGIPADVLHESKRLVLNQLKASIGATEHPAIAKLHDWATTCVGGVGAAHVHWLGTATTPQAAAIVNGAFYEVLDFHDTYIPCFMHAVSAVLPAVFALAEVRRASGKDFLTALALGIEAELAVATCLMPTGYYRGYVPAGLTGGVGAAAACAALARLDPERTQEALGIAMCTAFGLYESVGSNTLAYITGASARSGLSAFELAEREFTAPATAFEGEQGMFVTHCDEDPGKIDGVLATMTIPWRLFGQTYKVIPTETITHGIIGEIDQPNIPMSIGRAAPEYVIRVTDDDGKPTEVGDTGNLLIQGIPGLSLFSEYLHNEKATTESFDEHGYFMTGDRVTLLENGFIKFGDRSKDMLKVGGENVAASEIEQVIAVVPGVREAAVVAKKHPMLDEVPVVFIIPLAGVARAPADLHDSVMAACRTALADFKVPREIHFVDDMPRSTLEKVAKAELRKMLG